MLVNSCTTKTPSTALPNADFLRQNRILKGKPIILVCCVGVPMPLIGKSGRNEGVMYVFDYRGQSWFLGIYVF